MEHDEECEFKRMVGSLSDRVPLREGELQALKDHEPSLCYCLLRHNSPGWTATHSDHVSLARLALNRIDEMRRAVKRGDSPSSGGFMDGMVETARRMRDRGEIRGEVILIDFRKRRRISLDDGDPLDSGDA